MNDYWSDKKDLLLTLSLDHSEKDSHSLPTMRVTDKRPKWRYATLENDFLRKLRNRNKLEYKS